MTLPTQALTGLLVAVPLIAACRGEPSDRCLGFYVSSTKPCSIFIHYQPPPLVPPPPVRQPSAGQEQKRELAAGPMTVAKALSMVDGFYPTEALETAGTNRRLVALALVGIHDGQLDLSEIGDGQVKATYQMVGSCVGPPGTRPEVVCNHFVSGPQSFEGEILRDEHVVEFAVVLERGALSWGAKSSFVRPALPMNLPSFPSCGPPGRIELHENADGTATWFTGVLAEKAPCAAAADEAKQGNATPSPTDHRALDKGHETGSITGPANPLATCCAASPPNKRTACRSIGALVGSGKTSMASALSTLKGLGVTCHAPASSAGPPSKSNQGGVVDAW